MLIPACAARSARGHSVLNVSTHKPFATDSCQSGIEVTEEDWFFWTGPIVNL